MARVRTWFLRLKGTVAELTGLEKAAAADGS